MEEEVPPPPVPNGRSVEGKCAFDGLFLPKQPANYRPFMILDAEEAARQMAEDGTYTDGKSQAGMENGGRWHLHRWQSSGRLDQWRKMALTQLAKVRQV